MASVDHTRVPVSDEESDDGGSANGNESAPPKKARRLDARACREALQLKRFTSHTWGRPKEDDVPLSTSGTGAAAFFFPVLVFFATRRNRGRDKGVKSGLVGLAQGFQTSSGRFRASCECASSCTRAYLCFCFCYRKQCGAAHFPSLPTSKLSSKQFRREKGGTKRYSRTHNFFFAATEDVQSHPCKKSTSAKDRSLQLWLF